MEIIDMKIRVPKEIRDKLEKKASEENRSMNMQIVYILRKELKENA